MNEYTLMKTNEHRSRELQQARARHDLAQQLPAQHRPRLSITVAQVVSLISGFVH